MKPSSQRVVTTRIDHHCYSCDGLIPAGNRALAVRCSPHYDFNPNPGHWTQAWFHERCSPHAPEWKLAA